MLGVQTVNGKTISYFFCVNIFFYFAALRYFDNIFGGRLLLCYVVIFVVVIRLDADLIAKYVHI